MKNQLVVSNKILKADKYFNSENLAKLLNSPDNVRDKFYMTWHSNLGIRISDIVGQKKRGKVRSLGQEIDRIDWDNNRIETYDFKKDEWRWVYFPTTITPLLKMWLKERQKLEIKSRELFPYSEKTCNRIVKKWSHNIEFKFADKVSSHWFRHTFIRLSRRAGRDIKAVQQNTGDTVKTLLEWYSDLDEEGMRFELDTKPLFKES
ncbi:MAG: site-specific integrase [Nanoarchaeales archaeon]|nr:site-specific integrase [Nanoarchaeales archaeon]